MNSQSVTSIFQNDGGRGPPIFHEKSPPRGNSGRAQQSQDCPASIAYPRNPDKPRVDTTGLADASNIVIFSSAGRPKRTAASTIEALLFELRSGLSCLSGWGARDRLMRCDAAAIQHIAAQLLTWKDKNKPWLPPWSKDDVAELLTIWRGLK
jgi:hypothetical protein